LDSNKIEWNCPKVQKSIYVIEINLTMSIHDWVMNIKPCARIYINMQTLEDRKHLKKEEVTLKVGNGVIISAMIISSIPLHLTSGLIINLNNIDYIPSICKNIISMSCLDKDEYVCYNFKLVYEYLKR
jgi:hypothetical protein